MTPDEKAKKVKKDWEKLIASPAYTHIVALAKEIGYLAALDAIDKAFGGKLKIHVDPTDLEWKNEEPGSYGHKLMKGGS